MREEALVAQEARIHANIYFDSPVVALVSPRPSLVWGPRETKKHGMEESMGGALWRVVCMTGNATREWSSREGWARKSRGCEAISGLTDTFHTNGA